MRSVRALIWIVLKLGLLGWFLIYGSLNRSEVIYKFF